MKKLFTIFPAVLAFMFLWAGIASAHVTVDPNQVPADSWQKFVIKVPNEKDIATTKVEVRVPDGAEVMSIEPVNGWTFNAQKDQNGKMTSLIWTAEDKGLLAGQFIEFPIMAKVAKDAKSLQWKAYQTYSDGSVVKWIGPEDSEHPASVTKIVTATDQQTASATSDQTSQWPLYLSITAVVLSVIALFISLMRGRKTA
ncbi:YcnI family protein [Tuberibacillus calidus]|uniref:YcnI family copper-binding membrane protein n=1 Tax=Tuberibacillus calidus TaxID=340097 RepID=UPI0004149814|nr:YcnI family protein [Tuberibacillus calidus]